MSRLHFPNTIMHGAGSLKRIAEAAEKLNAKHLFIILSGRAKAEIEIIQEITNTNGLKLDLFTDYAGEPTIDHVNLAVKKLRASSADCVVALGGGTPIDMAKAVSVLAINNHLTIKNVHEQRNLARYPLIAIPTTAGTGSEVTNISVITDRKSRVKYNPAHPSFIPDIAILDPELTEDLPKDVTAYCGMDALAHAMEAYVSTKANPISDMFALEAMKLIRTYLKVAYQEPKNSEARDGMLRASCYAGIAFSNASTNLAHATARPLGTRFDLPHGLSVALTLPSVIAFGVDVAKSRYAKIATALETENVQEFVEAYNEQLKIYEQAKEKIDANQLLKAIPILAEDAQSGNGIQTNVQIPSVKDIETVYKTILKQLMEG